MLPLLFNSLREEIILDGIKPRGLVWFGLECYTGNAAVVTQSDKVTSWIQRDRQLANLA